jgi:hypothetical protein
MRIDSLYILLAIIIIKNLKCYYININNAFIELIMNKKIYIIPLKGVQIPRDTILKILKSLYNLK